MDHPDFTKNTVNAVVRYMKGRRIEQKRAHLMKFARSLTWDKRAQEWEALFAQNT